MLKEDDMKKMKKVEDFKLSKASLAINHVEEMIICDLGTCDANASAVTDRDNRRNSALLVSTDHRT
jgi:hypothetical protein